MLGFADYLAASHHRQGIMSAAVATLLKDWVIPRSNAQVIRTYTMTGNEGSVGVFRKNGSAHFHSSALLRIRPTGTCHRFKLVKTKKVWKTKKGEERGLNVLEWRLEDQ
jgi:RimJ/RimL family protein N-acetyltransferase